MPIPPAHAPDLRTAFDRTGELELLLRLKRDPLLLCPVDGPAIAAPVVATRAEGDARVDLVEITDVVELSEVDVAEIEGGSPALVALAGATALVPDEDDMPATIARVRVAPPSRVPVHAAEVVDLTTRRSPAAAPERAVMLRRHAAGPATISVRYATVVRFGRDWAESLQFGTWSATMAGADRLAVGEAVHIVLHVPGGAETPLDATVTARADAELSFEVTLPPDAWLSLATLADAQED